jgi:hypothetical protein
MITFQNFQELNMLVNERQKKLVEAKVASLKILYNNSINLFVNHRRPRR